MEKEIKIKGLDHLVMTVNDLEQTCIFYAKCGMSVRTFGDDRYALYFGDQKINLHLYKHEFEPTASHPTPGSLDLCFIVQMPVEKLVKHFELNEIKVIEGPIERTGTNGKILSIYIRDPDGNLLEFSNELRRV